MMNGEKQRHRLRIKGQVQGVGFRPFIFRLAQKYKLTGFVQNSLNGVVIEVEGSPQYLEQFLSDIQDQIPPLANIHHINLATIPVKGSFSFQILQSHQTGTVQTGITPDSVLCSECLREFNNPSDRRYHYPFINCTHCGPRYSIVTGLPYDRPQTTMSSFQMCEMCQREYNDPENRRFHAQPNACPQCGPSVSLLDPQGYMVSTQDAFLKIRDYLSQGAIVAVKGLGGFHLACNGFDEEAIQTLRERKKRPTKPFAVMVRDLETARQLVHLSSQEESLLISIEAPIVLARKRNPNQLGKGVAPQNPYLGIMLPYTPLHHLLFDDTLTCLVMTSGNLSNHPIYYRNEEALKHLAHIADWLLMHNRDIHTPCEDSIVTCMDSHSVYLRRSRGLAPAALDIQHTGPSVLGVGGELKNAICFLKGSDAYFSQHIGDLENPESNKRFESTIHHLSHILEIHPEIIACDLHPDYQSTVWAKAQTDLPVIEIQHHHAHIVSCMAENHFSDTVIGLSMDGTGFGTDGQAWGGEVMIASPFGFERKAHLSYRFLPGGQFAILEPWRMALSYGLHAFAGDFEPLRGLFSYVKPDYWESFLHVFKSKHQWLQTSSMGRLFDGISALLGFHGKISYEGEAAIALENCAVPDHFESPYHFQLNCDEAVWKIDPDPVILSIIEDIKRDLPKSTISANFHQAVADVLVKVCCEIRHMSGLNHVALSGGCFQNKILTMLVQKQLMKQKFIVLMHAVIPPNDGGLALGQAVAARVMSKK